jgi:dTDP-4-dehydrorhamnose reductase
MASSILLFGATSLLGFQLATMFPKTVLPFISPGNTSKSVRQWPALELHDSAWIARVFQKVKPKILLYCHAICDVPKCEVDPNWAREINVHQLDRVITVLPESTRLVYVSSDHVFGGDGVYTEESCSCPISVYGRTRVDAEHLVLRRAGSLVVRAGLGIGKSPDGCTGHLDWLRYRSQRNLPITIIQGEHRSAIWQHDLAPRIKQLAQSGVIGISHVSATRAVSRFDLAKYLIRKFQIPATFKIETCHQQSYPHLGRVELRSIRKGVLFKPLASVLDS